MGHVIDNPRLSRFELVENGATAFADYVRENGRVIVPHVEAPPALRGTGAAGRLMEGVIDLVRSRGEVLVPVCSYAQAYVHRHPEHRDVVGGLIA